MEYRQLGRSGLMVSTLTFGTATFGGRGVHAKWGSTDVDEARRLLNVCVDAGVNLVDTANVYSEGLAESVLGEVLRSERNLRERLLVATKVRYPTGAGPNDEGLSRRHVIAECDASLGRLGIDYIDLYQMHEWDGLTSLDETLAAFDELVTNGKVRYIGISNFAGWQLMKTMETARSGRFAPPVCQQIYYSLETRDAEYELIPAAIDQAMGVLVWSPLAGGLLSGKYRRNGDPAEGGRHLNDWHEPPIVDRQRLFDKIDVLVAIADERGVSAAEVALAWLLGRPAITSVVIGARTEAQLRINLGAADLVLSGDEAARLEVVSRPALIYPHWHQGGTVPGRLGDAELSLLRPHLTPDSAGASTRA